MASSSGANSFLDVKVTQNEGHYDARRDCGQDVHKELSHWVYPPFGELAPQIFYPIPPGCSRQSLSSRKEFLSSPYSIVKEQKPPPNEAGEIHFLGCKSLLSACAFFPCCARSFQRFMSCSKDSNT